MPSSPRIAVCQRAGARLGWGHALGAPLGYNEVAAHNPLYLCAFGKELGWGTRTPVNQLGNLSNNDYQPFLALNGVGERGGRTTSNQQYLQRKHNTWTVVVDLPKPLREA